MAISQAKSDKKSVGVIQQDRGGISVFSLGGIDFASGSGAPAIGTSGDMKASPKGSIYVELSGPDLYMKTSASGATVAWEKVGTQT